MVVLAKDEELQRINADLHTISQQSEQDMLFAKTVSSKQLTWESKN